MPEELSLGFGHFSNIDDEESWRTYSYDGLESTRELSVTVCRTPDLTKTLERLTSLKAGENTIEH